MRLSVANATTVDDATVPSGNFTAPVYSFEFDSRGSGQKFIVWSADTAAVTDPGVVDFGDPSDPVWTDTVMSASERNYMNTTDGASFVAGDTYGMAYEFFMKTKNHVLFMPDGTPLLPTRPKPEDA